MRTLNLLKVDVSGRTLVPRCKPSSTHTDTSLSGQLDVLITGSLVMVTIVTGSLVVMVMLFICHDEERFGM